MQERKRVGLFGSPCGGTTYVTNVLRTAGLDVGHERMRSDGIVCGFWALYPRDKLDQPKPDWRKYHWDVLGVVVRHPLLVAETLPQFIQRRHYHFDIPEVRLKALRYWVEVHTAARKICETQDRPNALVRVDSHFQDDIEGLCFRLHLPFKRPERDPVSKRKRWPRLTWAEWRRLDPTYAKQAREILDLYGVDEP